MTYRVEYSPDAEIHLRSLTRRDQAVVLDAVERHLTYNATVETRNRKPMRPNPLAPWELRVGRLRIYYDVVADGEPLVQVRAVGVKDGSRLRIGGEVMEL